MQDPSNQPSSTHLQDSSSINVEVTHVLGPHDYPVGIVYDALLISTSHCQPIGAIIVVLLIGVGTALGIIFFIHGHACFQ